MIPLRYATANQPITLGQFLSSTDGDTEQASLTIANTDIKLWKAGATTLASKNSGGATYISNGVYYITLDATDTNTIGPLHIFIHVSTALAVKEKCIVYPAEVYDYMFAAAGTGLMSVNTTKIGGTTQTGRDIGTSVLLAANQHVITDSGTITSVTNPVSLTGDLSATMKASVNAEVVDALGTDTIAEMAQGTPPVTPTFKQALMYLYMTWRNETTATASELDIKNDAGTVIAKAALSDDATTGTKGKLASGP